MGLAVKTRFSPGNWTNTEQRTAAEKRGETAGRKNGEPERLKSDAQINGGLSKANTGSSGGKAASHETDSRT